VLEMHILIVQATNRRYCTGVRCTIVPNELSHGPRFNGRTGLTKFWKVFYKGTQEFILDFPEISQELTLLLRSKEIRREDRRRRTAVGVIKVDRCITGFGFHREWFLDESNHGHGNLAIVLTRHIREPVSEALV
jgi:hypothetical protein